MEDHNIYNKFIFDDELINAIKLIKNMCYDEAEEILSGMHQKKEFNEDVTYYLGLVKYKKKKYAEAEGMLFFLGTFSRYYGAALSLAGRIKLLEKSLEKAEAFFAGAYESNSDDYMNVVYYAYTLRKQNKLDEAEKILRKCLAEDPLKLSACYELSLLTGQPLDRITVSYGYSPRICVEDILELIRIYHQAGDYQTALAACDLYQDKNALLFYHRAYYQLHAGNTEAAERMISAAEEANLDYVFPNKEITFEVLSRLAEQYGSARIKYLLGLIYASNGNHAEAVRLWSEAEDGLKYSVLNRNLGYFLWKHLHKPDKACEILEKGKLYGPLNPDIYYHLNIIYRELGEKERRMSLLSEMEALDSENQIITLTILGICNDFGMYARSLEILCRYKFSNWENESELNTRVLYENARIGKAMQELESGNIQEAVRHFNRVYEYPPNTGLGESYWSDRIRVYFLLMLCHEALGQLKDCLEYCRKIVKEYVPDRNPDNYEYYVKSVNKIVELEWIGV